MDGQSTPVPARNGLLNIVRNLAWILGGKTFGAICSLVYLAVLARSLGLRDFGHFSLLFGTAQALVAIAGFQTWQTLVRFGARHRLDGDEAAFGRLIWFCTFADVGGAITGCAIAALVYYGFGSLLELNPQYIDVGFLFACALIWARLTTPSGIVRVLDRFDVGTYVEAIVPTGRLIASGIILATGPSVAKFVFAWALFDLIAAGVYWIMARRLARDSFQLRHAGGWRKMLRENPGIKGFFGVTYGATTLDAVVKQGPLLAVGYFFSTSSAGLYRLADQLAQGVKQFAVLVARAVLPEFAVSSIADEATRFAGLVRSVTRIAALAGIVVLLIAVLFGEEVLVLIGGDDYARAAIVLIPLAFAAAFELASVSYEPLLYSTGNAGRALQMRAAAVVTLVIAVLSRHEPFGVDHPAAHAASRRTIVIASALVLAGTRPEGDPLARELGVAHKALIEIDGQPILVRVVRALREAGIERVLVSANEPAVIDLARQNGAEICPPASGPSESVAEAFERTGAPLIVTTADHALLEARWVSELVAKTPSDADLSVMMARRSDIERALPETQRTYLRFADGEWSGCNLFYLASPRAEAALATWRAVEADRKRPWKLVARLGLRNLFSYAIGRLTLADALARLGRRIGLEARLVAASDGRAAIDVDKMRDLDDVRRLLDQDGERR